ncbi:MAG: hypothetical protein JNM93_10240 [Bacteriovoracaceae bacterium]|nr:hypothetical protein [Bacteriovoracaceae bacterium]
MNKFNLFLLILAPLFLSAIKDEKKFIDQLKPLLAKSFSLNRALPETLEIAQKKYHLNYTLNSDLEKFIEKEVKKYRPDYASVVVIDNKDSKILAALDYNRQENQFKRDLSFSSSHPAASVFKLVTAASVLENGSVANDTTFEYRGKGSTLYRYQLKDKKDKWVREIKFENAFASSNNVIFAKAALNNLDSNKLSQMAQRFQFNQQLLEELEMNESLFIGSEDSYEFAELASGFNKLTSLSPIHACAMASIVANDGVFKRPFLLNDVKEANSEKIWWQPQQKSEKVIDPSTSKKLQEMMELTVHKGTARVIQKYMHRGPLNKLRIGGKTGSLTGGFPNGKRDWFVVYAKPNDESLGSGISLAVMIVNQKKWYVKAPLLAKNVIEYYYRNLFEHKDLLK